MLLKLILAPVVGGIIGYITNDLAIKMLFHPYKAVYIGKFHVPFTPGLIPSQKERIAKGLGNVIGGQLLNRETILKEALNPETEEKIRKKVFDFLSRQISSEESVHEKLLKVTDEEKISEYGEKALESCTEFAVRKLESAHIGEIIAEEIIKELYDKVKNGPLGFLWMRQCCPGSRARLRRSLTGRFPKKGRNSCVRSFPKWDVAF